MTTKEKLLSLNACSEAVEWAGDKTIKEIWDTCHRGDWMLWLFVRTNKTEDDFRLLTLTKGHCANTVRRLMKDPRSTNAVDVAIKFGEGTATREELNAAYAAAAAYAAYAAAGAAYAAYAADAARKSNQQLTADICRKYLPIPNF